MLRIHLFLYFFFATILVIDQFVTVEARYERVGYISDPIKLLLQDSYSSLKNRMYNQRSGIWKRPAGLRQIRKRKYTAFPPTFYSSYGLGAMPFNSRRSVFLPYNDLFFSG